MSPHVRASVHKCVLIAIPLEMASKPGKPVQGARAVAVYLEPHITVRRELQAELQAT